MPCGGHWNMQATTRAQRETGYDSETGLSGGGGVGPGLARYVAVAPRNASTDVRYLDFGA